MNYFSLDGNYYVIVLDANGQKQCVQVSYKIYSLFESEKRGMERDRSEYRQRLTLSGYIEELSPCNMSDDFEEYILRREFWNEIFDVVKTCTPKQQRRFSLYYFGDLTIKEIAFLENRDQRAIMNSIKTVKKKNS